MKFTAWSWQGLNSNNIPGSHEEIVVVTTVNEYTGSLYALEGKTALVTGGATGIGLMITRLKCFGTF